MLNQIAHPGSREFVHFALLTGYTFYDILNTENRKGIDTYA